MRGKETLLPETDIVAGGAGSMHAILQQYWGYSSFRPLQREAIDAVMHERDSLVVLPTGGGKSLCFQLPALAGSFAPGRGADPRGSAGRRRAPVALVISPLIALMRDQVDGLLAQGVPAACLHGGQSPGERAAAMDMLRNGECRLLYVAPERAVGGSGDGFRALLAACGVAYVAVDEAHCISQWGHDFRPEYRLLAGLRESFPGAALHAYTATATPRVQRDICDQLRLVDPAVLVGAFDRPNLTYRVLPRVKFRQQLQTILRRHPGEAGIVYCLSRRDVDELAASLAAEGVRALSYHAGLEDATRHRHQDAFLNESIDVMVATVAFGMGIDRSDVRFVVHDGAPPSLEQYQQEAGRAGRDGLPAECTLVTSPADFARWRDRLDSKGQWTAEARTLLRDMQRYAAATSCRHRALVGYFGQALQPGSCGACDWCLGELELAENPVVLAQKILSAVARTGQRWGAGHLILVLRGEATDVVRQRGHDTLSVFGLLGDMPVAELRGYIDQLTQAGFLVRSDDRYPTLQMSDSGVALMRGQAECVLFRPPLPVKGRKTARHGEASWAGVDEALFERLRALRLELARARGVPPYVIFHDSTLRELARSKPQRLVDLHGIPGVGQRKVEAFGAAVLDVILGNAQPGDRN